MKLLRTGSWNNGDVSYELYLSDTFENHLPVTSVAAIVFDEENKIGLTHNIKRGWEFPGGHIEIGESAMDALYREMKEEIAVSIKNIKIIGFRKTINHVEYINKSTGKPYPKESAVLWFSAELDEHLDISCLDLEEDVDAREFVSLNDPRALAKSDYVLVEEILKQKNQE